MSFSLSLSLSLYISLSHFFSIFSSFLVVYFFLSCSLYFLLFFIYFIYFSFFLYLLFLSLSLYTHLSLPLPLYFFPLVCWPDCLFVNQSRAHWQSRPYPYKHKKSALTTFNPPDIQTRTHARTHALWCPCCSRMRMSGQFCGVSPSQHGKRGEPTCAVCTGRGTVCSGQATHRARQTWRWGPHRVWSSEEWSKAIKWAILRSRKRARSHREGCATCMNKWLGAAPDREWQACVLWLAANFGRKRDRKSMGPRC